MGRARQPSGHLLMASSFCPCHRSETPEEEAASLLDGVGTHLSRTEGLGPLGRRRRGPHQRGGKTRFWGHQTTGAAETRGLHEIIEGQRRSRHRHCHHHRHHHRHHHCHRRRRRHRHRPLFGHHSAWLCTKHFLPSLHFLIQSRVTGVIIIIPPLPQGRSRRIAVP